MVRFEQVCPQSDQPILKQKTWQTFELAIDIKKKTL